MKLLTSEEMRAVDLASAGEHSVPTLELMRTAGEKAALMAGAKMKEKGLREALVICGRGNNGGDGLACVLELSRMGFDARALLLSSPGDLTGDPAAVLADLRQAGLPVEPIPDPGDLAGRLESAGEEILLVDAIFGTGFSPPPRRGWDKAIAAINSPGAPVLSIDLPSGLDADTGSLPGAAVVADWTVTLGAPKPALFVYPAAEKAGQVIVAGIGHPAELIEDENHRSHLLEPEWVRTNLSARCRDSHKGTFGHTLVLAGSRAMPGAALLTALGAVRSGAGLVTLAMPGTEVRHIPAFQPEVLPVSLPADGEGSFSESGLEDLPGLWKEKNGVAAGPGLTSSPGAEALILALVEECPLPLVLDADALNILSGREDLLSRRRHPTVLTPHPGELGRMVGLSPGQVQSDRLTAVRRAAAVFGHTVVLKGAGTIIADPEGNVMVNVTGNPGMASGGMGDVLTGLIAGLSAQGCDPAAAAGLGVYLHGLAGDLTALEIGPLGFTAGEVADRIPAAVWRVLEGHEDIEKI